MSVEDPLVNGIPLSSLRVVDLRDELEKRGLSKIGNKSVLTERLKAHICENELQNSGGETAVKEKSSAEVSTSGPQLVAAYLARQAEMLEIQKRDAERIRKEQTSSDDSHTDDVDIVASPRRSHRNTSRQQSESMEQNMEAAEEGTVTGSANEQDSVEPSEGTEETERNAEATARKSPSIDPNKTKLTEQQTEVDEINDEEIEKTVNADEEPEEDKQSDDESNRVYPEK
ncbi:hypothetical protein KIN20_029801 [Parelaphostrongylus tenuis]|uniref:SAP domain-containing protein n=1 Tax=Parelaphostrongylus tenuis TaxID=148309 RepID=A0AAD5R2X3_PARTN|nr:hypothetical protein KIN20_029801 [Parelaphostrongylus tenuis]